MGNSHIVSKKGPPAGLQKGFCLKYGGGDGARIRKMRNCRDWRTVSDRVLLWPPQRLTDPLPLASRRSNYHEMHGSGYNLVTVSSPKPYQPFLSDLDHSSATRRSGDKHPYSSVRPQIYGCNVETYIHLELCIVSSEVRTRSSL